MAITATQQTDIIKAVVGVFNASPGGYMSTLASAVQAGTTTAQLYDALASNAAFKSLSFAYSDGATNAQFASALASNLLGNSVSAANLQVAKDFVVANLNANVGKGAIIKAAVDFLSGMSKTDANWGGAATLFANKVTVATAYTIDQSGSATSVSALLATIATVDTTQASVDNAIAVNSGATYSLAAGATSYNEGDTATFTLTTTNVVSGTEVAYTISGVSAGDVTGALTGKATVSQGTATISVVTTKDLTTEGAETMKVALDNGKSSATATVADTSTTPVYTVTADAASANEGAKAAFTVTADQTIADGSTVAYTVSGVSAADVTGGTLSGNATFTGGKAAISVDLVSDATTEGAETITVTVGTATANATANDTSITPVLGTDTFQVAPGVAGQVAAKIDPTTLLANDFGSDSKVLSGAVTIVAGSEVNGTTSLDSGGFILFSPAVGATSGSFKYAVAGVTQTGTVNVLFNTSPVAADGTLAVTESKQASGTVTGTDADAGQTLTYAVVTAATKGTVTLDATTGAYTYDYTGGTGAVKGALAAAATASDTFTFTATDSLGAASKVGTVTVTTTGVEDAPQLISPAPAALSVKSGTTTTIKLTDYATDPDTTTSKLTFTPDAATALGGTITDNKDGTVSYKTGTGSAAVGSDSFSFTVTDGSTPVTTKISVGVSNVAPVATDFSLDAKTGVTLTVDLTGKATDADGNTLTPTITVGSVSKGGSAEVLNGAIVYTSTVGFVGTETVKYKVSDGFGGTSSEQTITFTVASNTGGTSGNDLLYGATTAENIDGLAGNDTIVGGGGLDTVTGNDGDDRVTFNDGAAQIQGGAGNDTLVVNSDAVARLWDFSQTGNQDVDASSRNGNNVAPVVRGFENLDASKASGDIVFDFTAGTTASTAILTDATGGDVATTTSVLTGSGGDNLQFSRATGTVTVNSGDGADTISVVATGKFNLDGGAGDDTIVYGDSTGATATMAGTASTIAGGAGNDTIKIQTMTALTVDGGAGNDTITFSATTASTSVVTGGTGDDTINPGGVTTANFDGGEGNDTFAMVAGLDSADAIAGGSGTDTISVTASATNVMFTKVTGVERLTLLTATNTAVLATAAQTAGIVTVDSTGGGTVDASAYTVGITINAASGAGESLIGGTVNDTFVFASNAVAVGDTITGGSGTDTISLASGAWATTGASPANLSLTLVTGVEQIVAQGSTGIDTATLLLGDTAATYSLTIDASAYTDASDALTVSQGAAGSQSVKFNMIGGAGKDYLEGGAGVDTISAGAGNDTIVANGGSDNLSGGDGNDTFTMAANLDSADTIDGGSGTDTISITAAFVDNAFTKVTAVERLTLIGVTTAVMGTLAQAAGIVTVDSTAGASVSATGYTVGLTINAAGGAGETLIGGTANDTFVFSSTAVSVGDVVTGGSGTDTISLASGAWATLGATPANLSLTLVTGVEQIVTLGSTGTDTATLVVGATAGTGSIIVDASAYADGSDSLTFSQGAAASQSLRFNMTGGAGKDYLEGGTGNDTISAGSGNDTIVANGGTDNLSGGDGNDTFTMTDQLTQNDTVAGGAGTDTMTVTANVADVSFSVVTSVERLTFLGGTSHTIGAAAQAAGIVTVDSTGGAAISGSAYTVGLTFNAAGGAGENLTGGTVDDSFVFSSTAVSVGDSVTGGAGTDTISLASGAWATTGATPANLSLTNVSGVEQIVAQGSTGTDTATLVLGDTAATYSLTVDASAYTSADTFTVSQGAQATQSVKFNMTGGAGADYLEGGTKNDTLSGGSGADTLLGNNGTDSIDGGAGNDSINGGLGADTLTGGAGNDTFNVSNAPATKATYDTITDLAVGDMLQFINMTTTTTISKITLDTSVFVFTDFLDAAAAGTGATTSAVVSWFQFGGNTFVVQDVSSVGTFLEGTDVVVKLTGLIDLSTGTLSAAGLLTVA